MIKFEETSELHDLALAKADFLDFEEAYISCADFLDFEEAYISCAMKMKA